MRTSVLWVVMAALLAGPAMADGLLFTYVRDDLRFTHRGTLSWADYDELDDNRSTTARFTIDSGSGLTETIYSTPSTNETGGRFEIADGSNRSVKTSLDFGQEFLVLDASDASDIHNLDRFAIAGLFQSERIYFEGGVIFVVGTLTPSPYYDPLYNSIFLKGRFEGDSGSYIDLPEGWKSCTAATMIIEITPDTPVLTVEEFFSLTEPFNTTGSVKLTITTMIPSVPEPATMTLLALGSLAMLRRRK